MKKINFLFILSFCLLCLLSACGKNTLTFNVPFTDTASLGDTYEINPIIAVDSKNKEYFPTVSVKCKNEDVVVTNNKFEIVKKDDYIITYTVIFNKKEISKQTIIEVKDSLKPVINVKDFNENVFLGDVVSFPEVEVTDNSNEEVKVEINAYYEDTTTEVEYTNDSKDEFIADREGYYTIKITATDKDLNVSTKDLLVIVRSKNEIENFDNEEFIKAIGNIGTPNQAEIDYNDNINYILQGNGSLKLVASESLGVGSYPEMTLQKPAITNVTEYKSISFYIYNNNNIETRVNIANCNDGWHVLKPYQWTKVEILKEEYERLLSGLDFTGANTAGASNLTGLRIYFEKNTSDKMEFFIDNFTANSTLATTNIENEKNANGFVYTNVDLEIKLNPTLTDIDSEYLEINLVDLGMGKKTLINESNNILNFECEGLYLIEYIAKDLKGKIAFNYEKLVVIEKQELSYTTIDNFESNNSHLLYEGNNHTKISINEDSNYVLDGNKSLKVDFNINDGYPYINTEKSRFIDYIDMYENVTFRIYSTGTKNHNILINHIVLGQIKPGLNTYTLSNEVFSKMLNNDQNANQADSNIYKLNKFTFFILNDGDSNELFSVYLDSFEGGFTDKEILQDEPVVISDLFQLKDKENVNIENILVTHNNTKIEITENTFIPTSSGEYIVSATISKDGYLPSIISFKLNCQEKVKSMYNDILDFEYLSNLKYIDQRGSQLSINENQDFVYTGIKSLKLTSTDGYPELKIDKSLITQYLNSFDYYSFYLYNDGNNVHNGYLTLEENNYLRFTLNPKTWTEVIITNDQLLKALNCAYNQDYLIIDIANDADKYENLDIYMDSLKGYFNNYNNTTNSIHILKSLNNLGNENFNVDYKILDPNSNEITPTDLAFVTNLNGKYEVSLTISGSNILETTMKYYVFVSDILLDFENGDSSYFIGNDNEVLSKYLDNSNEYNSSYVARFDISGNAGYPKIGFNSLAILNRLPDNFNAIEFYVYTTGEKNHRLLLSTKTADGKDIALISPKVWQKVVISKEDIINILGNEYLSMDLLFMVVNAEDSNEWFSVLFDNFKVVFDETKTIESFENSDSSSFIGNENEVTNKYINNQNGYNSLCSAYFDISGNAGYPKIGFTNGLILNNLPEDFAELEFYIYTTGQKGHRLLLSTNTSDGSDIGFITPNQWHKVTITKETLINILGEDFATKDLLFMVVNAGESNEWFSVGFDNFKVYSKSGEIQNFDGIDNSLLLGNENEFTGKYVNTANGYFSQSSAYFDVNGNAGYPKVGFENDLILNKLPEDFVAIEFYVYLTGTKEHRLLLSTSTKDGIDIALINSKSWQKVIITKEQLISVLGNDFRTQDLYFMVVNAGDSNEWFSAGFDYFNIIR